MDNNEITVVPLSQLGRDGRAFVARGWAKSWRAASESLRNRVIDEVLDDPATECLVACSTDGGLLGFACWSHGQLQWAYTKFTLRGLGVFKAIKAARWGTA